MIMRNRLAKAIERLESRTLFSGYALNDLI